ncbi:MAG: sigma-70 family RNA polymerase sigma factor [Xenococcus sp. (in: cyanobacteria)]
MKKLDDSNLLKEGIALASQVAKNFHLKTQIPADELESFLLEKLVVILKKYDPQTSENFKGYVTRCFQGYCLNYLRDHSKPIKIPRKFSDLYLKRNAIKRTYSNISDAEVAKEMGISASELRKAVDAITIGFSSLTTYSDSVYAIEDIVESVMSSPEEDEIMYIRNLPEQERQILEYHFFDLLSFEDIASLFSGETAQSIEKIVNTHVQNLRDILEVI